MSTPPNSRPHATPATNRDANPFYAGQFSATPDLLFVAIPQQEIIAMMVEQGEHTTLNAVCLSVACVADAITQAQHGD